MDECFEEYPDKPLFLYVAHNAPHFPLHAREEDTQKYRGRFKDVGWDKLRQARYERMVKMGLIDKKWALSPSDVPNWETYDEKMRDELGSLGMPANPTPLSTLCRNRWMP